MANKKIWDDELDNELFEYAKEGRLKGLSISRISETFSLTHPEFTKEQIRTHFYQIIKDKEVDEYFSIMKPWTDEDDDFIFSYVRKNKNRMNKNIMFEEIGKSLGRDAQHIAARYYKLRKKSKEEIELQSFLEKISKIDGSRAEKFIRMLEEFPETEKEKMERENNRLRKELEVLNSEREELKKLLLEKNGNGVPKKLIGV